MAQSCSGADDAVVQITPVSAQCKCMSQVCHTGAEDFKHSFWGPSKQVKLHYRQQMHEGEKVPSATR